MSKRFVNRYEYNLEFVKESVGVWWNSKFKKIIIVMSFLIVACVVLFLITLRIKWLAMSGLCLLPIVLFKLKKHIAIKTELERMKVIYKDKPLNIEITLDDNICMLANGNKRSVEFSSIETFVETKNLIVLFIKGSMTVAFSKEGFIEGSCEEFLLYIKQFKKKN